MKVGSSFINVYEKGGQNMDIIRKLGDISTLGLSSLVSVNGNTSSVKYCEMLEEGYPAG